MSKETQIATYEWIREANIRSGKIFRAIYGKNKIKEALNLGQINKIYKSLAIQSRLQMASIRNKSFHSMRVGAAQDLLKFGASISIMLQKGRWAKTDTLMRYLDAA